MLRLMIKNLQLPMHVFIIDDDEDNREMYAESLRWFGFRVTALSSPLDAARLVHEEMPDVLVSALRFRRVPSGVVLNVLRVCAASAAIPIIGLSTCAGSHSRALATHRFAAVVMKPCLPDALSRVIDEVVAAENAPVLSGAFLASIAGHQQAIDRLPPLQACAL